MCNPRAVSELLAQATLKLDPPRTTNVEASTAHLAHHAAHHPSAVGCRAKAGAPTRLCCPKRPALHSTLPPPAQLQGNLLFSLLEPRWPQLAGKITGMLLELDPDERDELFRLPDVRERRIEEAIGVLREAGDARAAACAPLTVSLSAAGIDTIAG